MFRSLVWWILLALLCCSAIKILLLLDLNKKIYTHLPGQCRRVEGIRRSVFDIQLLPGGQAIIASGFDLSLLANSARKLRGRLYSLDIPSLTNVSFKLPTANEIAIDVGQNANFKETFNPVGLTFYFSKDVTNLYVINRLLAGDTVECFIFKKKSNSVLHTKTITDTWIYNAEGIIAVGPDKFYLTNKFYFRWQFAQLLETLLTLTTGSLVFFDGKSASAVDRRLVTPAGIAVDKNFKHVFVSFGIQEIIRVYSANPDGSVVKRADMSLLTSANRIFADLDSSDLWITASPILHEILPAFSRRSKMMEKASSHVLRVKMQDENTSQWIVSELFANDGSLVNGGYSSIYHRGYLVVGGLGGQLLICQAPIFE